MDVYYVDVLLLITIKNIPFTLAVLNGMICNKAIGLKH